MYNDSHFNAAVMAQSPTTLRTDSLTGTFGTNTVTYTIPAPRSGKKIVLRGMSGAKDGSASGAATVTFNSDVNNDGTVETIGRLAATVAVQTAAWQRPAVASVQPSSKCLPLAVGGNGKSLKITFAATAIADMLLEATYQVVEDISRPTNAG